MANARSRPPHHAWLLLALILGCGHSEAFDDGSIALGSIDTGADVRLTLNQNQDHWPSWTEDGRGILYEFIRVGNAPEHRCVGLLPAAGGTVSWQLCDDRATQRDSLNSFPAYALGADGRLLYTEAVSAINSTAPDKLTLWLADSASPFQRRALLTLPTFAAGLPISWLADIRWTGPSTFIALAQDLEFASHCKFCGPIDSLYGGVAVVRGSITATGATLTPVTGTLGATSYSLAQDSTSIVFTLRDDFRLHKVPAAGGTDTAFATVIAGGGQLLGVSCRGTTCVVADDAVSLTTVTASTITFPSFNGNPTELRGVSLTTGTVQVLRNTGALVATPQISPVSGDVVAQVGGAFGHAQSTSSSASNLHLFPGLVP